MATQGEISANLNHSSNARHQFSVDKWSGLDYSFKMEIVLDASAIIAVINDEPEAILILEHSQNAIFISPNIISFEIANSLSRMLKKGLINEYSKMMDLINSFQQIPIKLIENNLENVIKIVWDYKIYAYDAFYLETARSLNIPLLTLDKEMRKIGKDFGIKVLGD